ncbi:TetR family transcriptional regulator [Actinokineospora fastidiosa]|uniref:TetR family transcriptional regulator n=1 Tax=Actinokineospora fastidiosa TaxID=1816 RepID=A0A918LFN6_9PSEU|nr:TetR family transcriptional regulator [Actinokineospora fastidiosa]
MESCENRNKVGGYRVDHARTLTQVSEVALGIRQERKRRTRQALLDAALRLLDRSSLAGLSLREVTREVGIVPTAFYRHFASMDELGVALVEESMRTLRDMLRDARRTRVDDAIRGSVRIIAEQVLAHENHFRFLIRERHGGVPDVRRAIATELRFIGSELATDLARFPGLSAWDTEDLRMVADLMVSAMLGIVTALLDRPRDPDHVAEATRVGERQLRIIALGTAHWRSPR